MVFFVEVGYDDPFETFADVFNKFGELPVILALPALERAKWGHCVFDLEKEVSVAWSLVGSSD